MKERERESEYFGNRILKYLPECWGFEELKHQCIRFYIEK